MNISFINNKIGNSVKGGECYGFAGWYTEQLNGIRILGTGKMFASKIWSDYPWASIGWSSGQGTPPGGWRVGDIVCFAASPRGYDRGYGHVGIVATILPGGDFRFYDQNNSSGRRYTRTVGMPSFTKDVGVSQGIIGGVTGYVRPKQGGPARASQNVPRHQSQPRQTAPVQQRRAQPAGNGGTASGLYRVNHNRMLNVHSQPRANAPVVARYTNGQTVNIQRVTPNGWGIYRSYNGQMRYIPMAGLRKI